MWQVGSSEDARASLARLEALLEQGYGLRLGLSELQPLQKLLGRAQAWEARAQAVVGPGKACSAQACCGYCCRDLSIGAAWCARRLGSVIAMARPGPMPAGRCVLFPDLACC